MNIDALAVGQRILAEASDEDRKKIVMDFFRSTHQRFGPGISYGALVVLSNEDVRILGGRDPVLLEFYIRHAIPEHQAAEIIKLESIH